MRLVQSLQAATTDEVSLIFQQQLHHQQRASVKYGLWTYGLDSGLDSGLDFGLDGGLDCGLRCNFNM